ncbi:ORF8 [Fowl aviadenovirus A]|nr:hypothetical protein [Fowl aviadenovirus A]APP94110.1 hypothetical protein [Fowl aviadenovirus A]ASU56032.1 ORF8 [Fowl aviadenovirus A]QGQ62275.1 ORF8 [Fowl aviadenovirus A]QGQ62311.1 ORF8 [Fowl aviadenovirus A]
MARNPFRMFPGDLPYYMGTISFTSVVPVDPRQRNPTTSLREMVTTGLIFNPNLTGEQLREYSFSPLVSMGRKAIFADYEGPQRIIHVTIRGRSAEPKTPSEALIMMEKAVRGAFAVPDWVAREYSDPLPHGITHVGDLGFPIGSVHALKMALDTLKIHVPRGVGVPGYEGLCGTTTIKAPRQYRLLTTGVFTKKDLKRTLPEPFFSRFFNQTPEVCAIKTGKNPFSTEIWCMTLGGDSPAPERNEPRNPHSLQDWARLGVMETCLRMSRRGLGSRHHPYHSL